MLRKKLKFNLLLLGLLAVFALVLFIVSKYVSIYFPNQEKTRVVKLSEYQNDSYLYIAISPEDKDNFHIELYDKDDQKLFFESSYLNSERPYFTTLGQEDQSEPGSGYFYYYGHLRKDKLKIVTKNKTDKIVIGHRVALWYLHGDRWTSFIWQ